MKEIPTTQEVQNFRGGPLAIPKFDEIGMIKTEPIPGPDGPLVDQAGKEIRRNLEEPGTIAEVLEFVVMDFPRTQTTMKSITECTHIMDAIIASRENGSGVLQLENAPYDWLIATLKLEEVGVKMFGMNLPIILAALGEKT